MTKKFDCELNRNFHFFFQNFEGIYRHFNLIPVDPFESAIFFTSISVFSSFKVYGSVDFGEQQIVPEALFLEIIVFRSAVRGKGEGRYCGKAKKSFSYLI